MLLLLLGHTESLIQDTWQQVDNTTTIQGAHHGNNITLTDLSRCHTQSTQDLPRKHTHNHHHTNIQPSTSVLTGRKGVWSLRCPRSSPEAAAVLSCRPLSLHLSGPRLQRPAVNRQKHRSDRWDKGRKNKQMERQECTDYLPRNKWAPDRQVRALACLHETGFQSKTELFGFAFHSLKMFY